MSVIAPNGNRLGRQRPQRDRDRPRLDEDTGSVDHAIDRADPYLDGTDGINGKPADAASTGSTGSTGWLIVRAGAGLDGGGPPRARPLSPAAGANTGQASGPAHRRRGRRPGRPVDDRHADSGVFADVGELGAVRCTVGCRLHPLRRRPQAGPGRGPTCGWRSAASATSSGWSRVGMLARPWAARAVRRADPADHRPGASGKSVVEAGRGGGLGAVARPGCGVRRTSTPTAWHSSRSGSVRGGVCSSLSRRCAAG